MRFPFGTATILLAAGILGCQPAAPIPNTVSVDPRIELMGVVQYLDGYMLSTRYDFDYKDEVEEAFGSLRDHPAVTMFHDLAAGGFSFDAVPKAMLSLSDPPELNRQADFPADAVARAGGEEVLDDWIEAMRDFAVQSNFMEFYQQHQPFYDSLTTSATPTMTATVDALETYLGSEIWDAHVILGVLLHHGGFSTLFQTQYDRTAYAIIGPAGGDGSQPGFGAARRLGRIAWHEFSHTVINEITAQHRDWVEEHEDLMEPIREQMARQAYTDWETVVNEHIIRAINVRMVMLNVAPRAGQAQLESEIERGFVFLPALTAALEQYEQNRDTYPTIADFYPELLEAFE